MYLLCHPEITPIVMDCVENDVTHQTLTLFVLPFLFSFVFFTYGMVQTSVVSYYNTDRSSKVSI